MKRYYSLLLVVCVSTANCQSGINKFLKPSDTLNTIRRNTVVISEVVLATGALFSLNQLWYSDYERSGFKIVDDSNEWLQMDKLGHVFSSYQIGKFGANALNWAGVRKKDQLIYGATLGFTFLTAVEVMDGYSEEWGFSWADVAANALGTGLYIGQELLWEEQRISMKYSFYRTNYAQQRPAILGEGILEEILKDYNGQTYWLSANLSSFFKSSKLPKWLNLAFGYSGDGMLTGSPTDFDFPNQNRVRQFYLSLDIDLTKIKTNSHVLRTIFDIFNMIKVPFPALEYNSNGNVQWHFIYF